MARSQSKLPKKISKQTRSRMMRSVKSADTKPEMMVRRWLFGRGYRYRTNYKELPGKPDIVFTRRKKVIFVHGCFWHQHSKADCPYSSPPKSNLEYWTPKFKANKERDARNIENLEQLGWRVIELWECELEESDGWKVKLEKFISEI